jgi:cation transport regulator ChaC
VTRGLSDIVEIEMEDLPTFLRIPQEERKAAWRGRKLTTQGTSFRVPAKHEEAATRKLRREIEEAEAAKKAARFEYLRSLRGKT